jgi:hypothetical protein
MPVRKFRSIEEMSRPIWYPPGSPQLAEAIRRLWHFGSRTSRKRFRPGVHRFHSIEEMQAAASTIVIEAPESS